MQFNKHGAVVMRLAKDFETDLKKNLRTQKWQSSKVTTTMQKIGESFHSGILCMRQRKLPEKTIQKVEHDFKKKDKKNLFDCKKAL